MACHLPENGSSTSRIVTEEGSSESIVRINIVRIPDFRVFVFSVDKNILISRFKERIANYINIPADQQILLFMATFAKDDHPLSHYNLGYDEHTHHVVTTMEGLLASPVSNTEANLNISTAGTDADPADAAAIPNQLQHPVETSQNTNSPEIDEFHSAITILSDNSSRLRSELDILNNQMGRFEDMDAADETQTDSMLLEYTDVVRIDQLSRKINGLIENFMKVRMRVHLKAFFRRMGIPR